MKKFMNTELLHAGDRIMLTRRARAARHYDKIREGRAGSRPR